MIRKNEYDEEAWNRAARKFLKAALEVYELVKQGRDQNIPGCAQLVNDIARFWGDPHAMSDSCTSEQSSKELST